MHGYFLEWLLPGKNYYCRFLKPCRQIIVQLIAQEILCKLSRLALCVHFCGKTDT
jgi:hypothetical protein